jgi:membrane protein required for cytochrome c biosynthesis
MRTALVLLFLLALGAIPGALLPQRSLNADKVDEYIANNGRVGEIYDKLQLYDVFSSVWSHRDLRAVVCVPYWVHPSP